MLATACVKIPEFKAHDGGPGDGQDDSGDGSVLPGGGVTVMPMGTGAVATLPGLYEMKFSTDGYHFPYNWGIGATEPLTQVLRSPAATTCTLERDFGVAYLPGHVLTSVATGGATPFSEPLMIEVPGPGIAKVRLEWSAALSACTANANGYTTFSFFPDGRISRMDVARMSASVMASDCECTGSATEWRVYGYTTFTRGTLMGVQGAAIPDPSIVDGAPLSGVACIESNSNAFRIGVGWKNISGLPRLRAPDLNTFALIGDLAPSATTLASGHLGDTTTTLWPSLTAGCTALRNQVMPYTDDPQITIDNGSGAQGMGMGQDGIYGGETAFQPAGRDTIGSMVTIAPLNAPTPPFGLWLDFKGYAKPTPPTVTKSSNPTGAWYTVQRPTSTQYLFWFPDGMEMAESITIRAD